MEVVQVPGTESNDYVIRVLENLNAVDAQAWDALLARQPAPTPFMRHAYLSALESTGCATATTGWQPQVLTLWQGDALAAATIVYRKSHSHGEYVFDWAWARAYAAHGLAYYPKAVTAIPFTPVPGTRLLATDPGARTALAQALVAWSCDAHLSSLHVLFADEADLNACEAAGLQLRHTVQFHWTRPHTPCSDLDQYLDLLNQDKRKKIRQERRKVQAAGVRFRPLVGRAITEADWDFFYRCYERTYLEHGNPPYLSRAFFAQMARDMAGHWLLFVAERQGQPIACSLIALDTHAAGLSGSQTERVAYGRYWGALERVDCLHFEACYYQPIDWCLQHGYDRFEGGAQGEHKMARALLPVRTSSAHWLAHPAFARAVDEFLVREGRGVAAYLDELEQRSPLRHTGPQAHDAPRD
jgi:uncharacterized protein